MTSKMTTNALHKNNLLSGEIFPALLSLAMPIMGTYFLQMAYNLVNMIWIGRLGSGAVAAIGTAGFFTWLSMALIRLVQVGTEVNVSQAVGAKDYSRANDHALTSLTMGVVLAIAYGALMIIFNRQLIVFFGLTDEVVNQQAQHYLIVLSLGMVFSFINPIISCIYNGSGDSKTPFLINSLGLAANIILDPLFIFVFKWGVIGAAVGTVVAQLGVTVLLFHMLIKRKPPFHQFKFRVSFNQKVAKGIFKIGLPVAVQNGLFTMFGILLAKIIAGFGPDAIAAQKVGVQVEALSYMTATGFASALSSFTGQNYGAGNLNRVKKGILTAGLCMAGFGVLTTALLYFAATPIYKIFISSGPSVAIGVSYLKILAISQMFMCLEITLSGGYNGLGRTMPPAIMSIFLTGLRVPAAIILAKPELMGLDGVWWSITFSSMAKGVVICLMMAWLMIRLKSLKSPKVYSGYDTVTPADQE